MSAPHTGPIRLAVRTHPFHGCDTSSILVWVAIAEQIKAAIRVGTSGDTSSLEINLAMAWRVRKQ